MKLLLITPTFYPATYWGGPIFSLYGLCNALAGISGSQVKVLTTDSAGIHLNEKLAVDSFPMLYPAGYQVYFCRRWLGTSVSPKMVIQMFSMIRWADVVHLTGVYSFPSIPTILLCKIFGKPLVWSPRGALQRWEGTRRRRIKTVWEWACKRLAPKKVILHVTSEKEAEESQQKFSNFGTVIIPNGVEIPVKLNKMDRNDSLCLLYIGRIDPKKGIENLLEACKKLDVDLNWSLTIAGLGEKAYTKVIQEKISELKLSHKVKMIGEVLKETKTKLFENSDIVVVPSYTENFAMVVAEALAYGVPVIASKGTPWKHVDEIGCGLWVNNDIESLAKALETMSRMSLQVMGQRGREWMQKEFSWNQQAEKMVRCYKGLIKVQPNIQCGI